MMRISPYFEETTNRCSKIPTARLEYLSFVSASINRRLNRINNELYGRISGRRAQRPYTTHTHIHNRKAFSDQLSGPRIPRERYIWEMMVENANPIGIGDNIALLLTFGSLSVRGNNIYMDMWNLCCFVCVLAHVCQPQTDSVVSTEWSTANDWPLFAQHTSPADGHRTTRHTEPCADDTQTETYQNIKEHSQKQVEEKGLLCVFVYTPHNVTFRVRTNRFCGLACSLCGGQVRFVGSRVKEKCCGRWLIINECNGHRSRCCSFLGVDNVGGFQKYLNYAKRIYVT